MFSFLKDMLAPTAESDPDYDVRVAAASLLLSMSRADSDVADSELQAVRLAIKRLLGLPSAAVDDLMRKADAEVSESVSLYDFTKVLHRQQTKEEKQELVQLLWSVAIADGEIDPQEELLVRKVAGLLYLSQPEFISAKKAALAAQ